MGSVVEAEARPDAETCELARRLCAEIPLVETAILAPADDGGYVAVVTLDPLLVRSRAVQQGLGDTSVEAAARDPRVQRTIAAAVERVNAERAPSAAATIRRYEVSLRDPAPPGRGRYASAPCSGGCPSG